MRLVVFYVNGVRYQAPEAWLVGAYYVREKRGMDPVQAYEGAIRHWAQQTQLAAAREARWLQCD